MATKFRPSDGDWTCPDAACANVNFARRDLCNRCGKPKEDEKAKVKKMGIEIGKDAAEKSKGLFSADDWMCTKCGNVNWARRSTCNVCNAPRFGEVEERTGYGGGYNERGNVEYKERVESDDEFDEFGRIKKKFRKSDAVEKKDVPEPSTSNRIKDVEKEEEEEDDDDEDDDDDGDLSKYDLSGWGDESSEKPEDSNSKPTAPNNSDQSSKSEKNNHQKSGGSSSRRQDHDPARDPLQDRPGQVR
uniref:Zinc finger Ran-binding domain-containing protein 2 n=1 Tax=Alona affinis TaxID=381656 RepID=A0A9N6WPE8_9CRUS|nr:EOG090X0ECZ [Alona affinis]